MPLSFSYRGPIPLTQLRCVLDRCGGGGVRLGGRVVWVPPSGLAFPRTRPDYQTGRRLRKASRRGHPPPDRCSLGTGSLWAVCLLQNSAISYSGSGW